VYNAKRVKQSEVLQLLLPNALYSQKGSEKAIFQGGTALRWVYNGQRFSEDLDFVTQVARDGIERLLRKTTSAALNSCIAQFGPGRSEFQSKPGRKTAFKAFFINNKFSQLLEALRQLTLELKDQGMENDALFGRG
jgi:hypothetical protein